MVTTLQAKVGIRKIGDVDKRRIVYCNYALISQVKKKFE